MYCCGDHVVSIPRPDDLILSASCSDTLARGDAWARIWPSSELDSQMKSWKAAVNIQMVLSFQSRLQSIRQRIPKPTASAECQRKPEKICNWTPKKKRILQRILIVFHAVAAFPWERSPYQRLPLLRCSAIPFQNQQVEEVQEHEPPSACRRTTVSLCPRTRIRRRKS